MASDIYREAASSDGPVVRLNRSELSVPGNQPRMIEKAAGLEADVVLLDLEDAVPPDKKDAARKNIIAALHDLDWSGRTVSVRVNAFDTVYTYRDVIEVVEQAGDRLDLLMLPKVNTAEEVVALDILLSQIERAKGRKRRLGLELMVETPRAVLNLDRIAQASGRIESLHLGVGDLSAAMQARVTDIGGASADYGILAAPPGGGDRRFVPGDMWHYPAFCLVTAARAFGLRPIDCAFGDFNDGEAYEVQAKRAAALGFEGKWAIHPAQIGPANRIFAPPAEDVVKAGEILQAMAEAEKTGSGAVTYGGRMIDYASLRQARAVLQRAELIKTREKA